MLFLIKKMIMISTFNGIDDGHWSPLYSSARGEVIIIILIIIIIITRIQLGMECVRGPRKFQLIITTVTRILEGNDDDEGQVRPDKLLP